jgi:3-demethoxyubiquinol 3-hydroxylase
VGKRVNKARVRWRAMELSARLHPDEALGGRVLKVNHAGENGAVHIYAAQILMARVTARALVPELVEFKAHEEKHRAIFLAELQRRGVARCRSYGLCAVGGYTLGLVTGLFGRRAIAATTVAVERVVLGHLEQQMRELAGKDEAAVEAISRIVDEERQHHDRSASHARPGRWWLKLLTPVVAASTESVIWLGMHL